MSTVNSLCWNLLSAPGGVYWFTGVPGGSHHKEATCNAGDAGAVGLFSGSGRFLGEGNGCSLQYSRLENSIDRLSPWDSQRVGHNWVTNTSLFTQNYNCVCTWKKKKWQASCKICSFKWCHSKLVSEKKDQSQYNGTKLISSTNGAGTNGHSRTKKWILT